MAPKIQNTFLRIGRKKKAAVRYFQTFDVFYVKSKLADEDYQNLPFYHI